ncbi:MAG TPA: hypothetical protein VMQ86_14965 [Bryobacteraceae bacterium]|jgi:hypothetical protein|nr:hypothetical protein [Bryobacteraceae bacterium]
MTPAGPVTFEPSARVFLNFPYDRQFGPLYLAYIAGVCSFGLVPRVALELPGGKRRPDRIVELILSCSYSFHDLSRVELDLRRPRTRMNMPFELGIAVMASYQNPGQHTWCVFEKNYRRVLKSLDDLAGSDIYCHDGSPKGVLKEIANALVRERHQPDIKSLLAVYEDVTNVLPAILRKRGAKSCYEAAVFRDLVFCAQDAGKTRLGIGRG